MIRKVLRIAVIGACIALIGISAGALNPLLANDNPSSPDSNQRERERVAIGPEAGQVGYLDPAAFDPPAVNEQLSRDGPFVIYDLPKDGSAILWYFHSVGVRQIGDSPTSEEVSQHTPVTRGGVGAPPTRGS